MSSTKLWSSEKALRLGVAEERNEQVSASQTVCQSLAYTSVFMPRVLLLGCSDIPRAPDEITGRLTHKWWMFQQILTY